ncbi:terpenoid cyclases/Protein prenyltransferase [Pleurotus eryngii]|uniref:Terpenoid cyclases/Protein prenyltransferase n=1 Tax=Pleurotus eryngii TaxID=5323 RepID=A0A9P5ZY16_PLEER|nr:terpenoid cyclases/Protein prenyltransferase [Pleurotus eryngii]
MPVNLHPGPDDAFPTPASHVQADTEAILLKLIPDQPLAKLHKNAHVQFLARNFVQGFPIRYTSQDASQPWLMFWTLQSFSVLRVGLDPGNKQRAIDTILTWQHPDGGFGGDPGQSAHLLATYVSVCSLSIAGKAGENGGWDQIDREKMYKFFMSLKQPDGSFPVRRGIYCLLVTATLLDILTLIASCQTYEGGFASASQPYFSSLPFTPESLLPSPRPLLGEAHGGYTYCSLATWVMLRPLWTPPLLGRRSLLRWLVQMQGLPIEMGGFKGRTNNLVDGCYSWWIGGSLNLLAALGVSVGALGNVNQSQDQDDGQDWHNVDDSFFSREALQEYILSAGQHPAGGLRDNSPKSENADAYHTMYCLSGLFSAQHRMVPSHHRRAQILSARQEENDRTFHIRCRANFAKRLLNSLSWTEDEEASKIVGGDANRVVCSSSLRVSTRAKGFMAYFYRHSPNEPRIN